jgi:phosphoribosylformylglycinamidine synthase
MTDKTILENLKTLLQTPDLASKKWVYEQYDSGVMNDTIQIGGDAAIVRVHNTQKALAITTDCTPRYVEADPFIGAMQAVVETYRNISAVGGNPLAITNCLNFGNPQKPEIMGQIVRAIQGITKASKALDYPVVSGNVSLYNETDGRAIQPTPAIGGVGLLKDLNKRCSIKFKNINDAVFMVGKTAGHLDCSLYQREILKSKSNKNPPSVDLSLEKKHSEFVRKLIAENIINACHDVSDGGLLVALFEMCNILDVAAKEEIPNLGIKINQQFFEENSNPNALMFGEDQARYIIAISGNNIELLSNLANQNSIDLFKIGEVVKDNIAVNQDLVSIKELQNLNEKVFPEKFS